LPRGIALVGGWYFVSGFACLLWAGTTHSLSPWLMGAPFFTGQLLMAAILHFSADGRDEEE
jgi:hypothetical protein